MEPIEKQIVSKIKKARACTPFFAMDFRDFGNSKSINKALERLEQENFLYRVARGIYVRPKRDKLIGLILPGIDDIVKAIAKRDRARIMPTGSFALYKLGLTTQVPLKIVYYTDSSPRKIRIGKFTITFKKMSAKNLSMTGEISKLAILALKEIGENNITEIEIKKIAELLRIEKPYRLKHDLNLAPNWIKVKISKYLKGSTNESSVSLGTLV